jgi:hypothetical protein
MKKEYLRNPMFYVLAVPVLAGLWMLYVRGFAYPSSVRNWGVSQSEYEEAQKAIEQILKIEPQRLAFQQEKSKNTEFDYTNIVDQFTRQFGIAPGDYTLNVRGATKKAGKTVKSADLSIKTIDIETLCKFLSAVLARWPELECEMLRLDKLASGKNAWKITLRLTYYY